MSFYDPCLLIIKNKDVNFSITELQTDNTFHIRIKAFINKKKTKIIKAKLKAKSQTMLETGASKNFNSSYITIED